MRPITPIVLRAWTATTCAGAGRAALLDALRDGRSGLRPNDFSRTPIAAFIGRIEGVEDAPLPGGLARWDCRNNRLAWLALQQDGFLDAARAAIARHGPGRVAVLIGTSTSSIGASEEAYARLAPDGGFPPDLQRPEVHTPHSLGGFVREALGARGPCCTVATACSSSAKVFAQAERLLRLGLVDAAVVGGVDSLCQSILYGFHALQLVAPERCRPFDARRQGISLAEAGGYALLERAGADDEARSLLIGWGESSDAHHMAAPHPEGRGAERAALDALARAGLDAGSIDYLNLHGTATPKNDATEAAMVARHFAAPTRASSTKGLTGHTLGAAGIVEAVITLLALEHGFVPGSTGLDAADAELPEAFRALLAPAPQARPLRVALSHSFGFGGSNAVLAFAKDRAALEGARR
ncbi:beta-ketoacyl-ACP synthase [Methylibium sp.]|uniref:beta-ketoacyl-ACP synthase n=1 Tax=Methylibium sp. TaxID=2067992 RepID=UPI002DB95ED1|nr:beta-ketoacyl-ACP synthase [Methylibium sp.]